MKLFRLSGLISLLLCTLACIGSSTSGEEGSSTPITVASASQRSAALLGDIARDAGETGKATIDLESVENAAELFADLFDLFAGSAEGEGEADIPTTTEFGSEGDEDSGEERNENEGEREEDWGDDFEVEEEDFSVEEFANEIRKAITEEILIEENLEAIDGNTATFLIRGENFCGKEEAVTYDQNGNEVWTEEPNTDCIESMREAQLRIVAKLIGEAGIELKIFIGAQRTQVVVLTSRPNFLSVDLYLSGLQETIEMLEGEQRNDDADSASNTSSEFNDPDGSRDTPEDEEWPGEFEDEGPQAILKSAKGVIGLAITINGSQDAAVSISITEEVEVVLEDNGKTMTISIGESNSLLNLVAQPLLGLVSLGMDLNNVDLSGPMSLLADETATGELFAHLAGIQFEIDLDDTAQSIAITNVGLGDSQSTVSHNDTTIVALDLNQNAGRSFNVQLDDVGEKMHLTLMPEFMLSADFNFQAVERMFDDVPSFLLDETISIQARGDSSVTLTAYTNEQECGGPEVSSPSEEAPLDEAECDYRQGLKVVDGIFEIDSTKADNPLRALSNQCITGDAEPRANESHELLRELSVIVCE